jgi:hypothetical protein
MGLYVSAGRKGQRIERADGRRGFRMCPRGERIKKKKDARNVREGDHMQKEIQCQKR